LLLFLQQKLELNGLLTQFDRAHRELLDRLGQRSIDVAIGLIWYNLGFAVDCRVRPVTRATVIRRMPESRKSLHSLGPGCRIISGTGGKMWFQNEHVSGRQLIGCHLLDRT
jgi:hypothetical protein